MRTTEPRLSSSQRLRRVAPTTIWVIWCFSANSTTARAGSSPAMSYHSPPTSTANRRRWSSESAGASSSFTLTTSSSPLDRAAMRAARRTTPSLPGAPVTATMIRSAVSHTPDGCLAAR